MRPLPNEYLLLINLPLFLTGLSSPDERKELFHKINWRVVFHLAKYHKLLPSVFIACQKYMPADAYEKFRMFYIDWRENAAQIRDLLKKIDSVARENGLEYLVHKGAAFGELLYDDPFIRYSNDIDLLIPAGSISAFDSVFRKNGLIPCYFDRKNNTKHLVPFPLYKRREHHELCQYIDCSGNGRIAVELGTALHTLSAGDTDVFFAHSRRLRLSGLPTYSCGYAFLAMCENIYNNGEYFNGVISGESNLRDYADLFVFLCRYGKDLCGISPQNHPAVNKLMYEASVVLSNLESLYGDCVPETVKRLASSAVKPEDLTDIPWESPFVSRLFGKASEKHEFVKHIKRLGTKGLAGPPVKIFDKPFETLEIMTSRYPFSVKVRPYKNDGRLLFELEFCREFACFSENFFFEIRILHPDTDDPVLLSVAALFFSGENIVCKKHYTESFIYSTVKRQLSEEFASEDVICAGIRTDGGAIKTTVAFDGSELNLPFSSGVYVQFFVFEKMYGDHCYLISAQEKELFDFRRLSYCSFEREAGETYV